MYNRESGWTLVVDLGKSGDFRVPVLWRGGSQGWWLREFTVKLDVLKLEINLLKSLSASQE